MKRRVVLVALSLIAGALYLNNASSLVAPRGGRPTVLAHRGLAQDFDRTGLTGETCTAARMMPPVHGYLENTIASMREAFRLGAGVVEIDVHPTTDGAFAVFHDWTIDCRTDGRGVTREQSLAHLKTLDVGYGYTADGGKTFPFRGRGVGLMPSLDEVLAAFPDKSFLINVKSNDPIEGRLLAERLQKLPPERLTRLMAYGGDKPIEELKQRLPQMRLMSLGSIKTCYLRYVLTGWSGYVPAACRNSVLLLPVNVAPWLWGWPNRLVERMASASTLVFAVAPFTGGFSNGIDTAQDLERLPEGYNGGIFTDRIDVISKMLAK